MEKTMGNLEKSFAEIGKSLDDFFTTIQNIFLCSKSKNNKKYIAIDGDTVILDISDLALGRHKTMEGEPLRHNKRVRANFMGRNATIKGVGAPDEDPDVEIVFYVLDGRSGVSYSYPEEENDFSSIQN